MSYVADPDLAAFLNRLPKTETHLHIEGAAPYDLLQTLHPAPFLGAPACWDDDFRYDSFGHFATFFDQVIFRWYTSAERYHQACKLIFAKVQAQNVKYLETSICLMLLPRLGCSGPELMDAILSAAPLGLEVRVFAGICRDDYQGPMKPIIDDLVNWEKLAGIDLHGFETLPIDSWTPEVWARARAAGKFTKAHAGEFGGAGNVREVVERLGVNRVEHGVRAAEDPEVMKLLVDRDVTLDVCPISNVKLRVAPTMAQHPIRTLMAAGVRCTVNSDDPIAFGNTLNEDYTALVQDLNYTRRELVQVARNGFEIALLAPEQKRAYLTELDEMLAAL
jgi:adenosine deaminase